MDTHKRIELMDALRGLSILLMVAYHCGVDLYIFGLVPEEVLFSPLLSFLQPFFAGIFILLAGVSSRFSRSNLKRGLIMLACAAVISAAGVIMQTPIWFGILHLLASCTLLFHLLEKFGITSVTVPFLAFLALFFNAGYWPDIPSADYFTFFPWMFLFFSGTYLGIPIKDGKFPKWFYEVKIPFFPAVGRRTLLIYMLHQPVVYGAVWLIAKFVIPQV